MIKRTDRIGKIKIMNNGMKAKIIDYRKSNDIDIQFEDGTIVKNKDYKCFKIGTIAHPSKYEKNQQRIGEVRIMNNGMKAKIINYRKYRDIDVQFEDGTIIKNKRYCEFLKGSIVNPNNKLKYCISLNEFTLLYYFSQLGFKKHERGTLKKYGFGRMELDAFNENLMIAIEYDGEVHKFRYNTDIKKDQVCRKANIKLIRIRERMNAVSENSITFCLNNKKHFSKEYEKILQDILNYIIEKYNSEASPPKS